MIPAGLWGPKEFAGMTDEELHQVKMGTQGSGSTYYDLATAEQQERQRKVQARTTTTVNISNSTVAALNLGNIAGDLNSSIQILTNAGHAELAQAVRQLTDAIAALPNLSDTFRRDLIEHLTFVSTEATLPAEKRKMAPLKSSIETLKSSISVVAQLATLWQAFEQALKAVGILHA